MPKAFSSIGLEEEQASLDVTQHWQTSLSWQELRKIGRRGNMYASTGPFGTVDHI